MVFFLLWIFELIEIDYNNDITIDDQKNVTIIIENIKDIDALLLTIDSIQSQDYNLNKS